jgi:hypothetical protein
MTLEAQIIYEARGPFRKERYEKTFWFPDSGGCFGIFLARPLGWDTLAEDLVLTAFSYTLYRLAQP